MHILIQHRVPGFSVPHSRGMMMKTEPDIAGTIRNTILG